MNLKEIFRTAVCVDKCPKATGVGAGKFKCRPTKAVPDCAAINSYATTEVVTYCFPQSESLDPQLKQGWKLAKEQFLSSPSGQYFNDMYLSSRAVYGSIAMAPIYCFVFIGVMSAFAEYISWCIIILVQLGLIAGAVLAYFMRVD